MTQNENDFVLASTVFTVEVETNEQNNEQNVLCPEIYYG